MSASAALPAPPAAPISFEDTRIAFEAKTDGELRQMYALFAAMNSGGLVKMGSGLMQSALKIGFPGTKFLIKHSIFKQFCGGETIQECKPVIAELGRYRIGTILDYSVEGAGDDRSFDRTRDEIRRRLQSGPPADPHAGHGMTARSPERRCAVHRLAQCGVIAE
ncbi:MAG: hypothetical protein WKG07_46740 [Hymenobacter sp.]